MPGEAALEGLICKKSDLPLRGVEEAVAGRAVAARIPLCYGVPDQERPAL